ncbi:GvpL/GvpF family gas vesicle protein [Zooshikella harenae]|uniref:GvpL/GvpF family gas vesicle protein n=1 Tax=Zooshikella harenae TaxID=2827238 RepID=A0ABS5ZGC3_9GAMM|nr:GvpL/GvpF family gas vesicle protein [Zooshikella harenae]MBU2712032.1 GvpL/GvpF family gas vesicle protein [Zooshikella harenae]
MALLLYGVVSNEACREALSLNALPLPNSDVESDCATPQKPLFWVQQGQLAALVREVGQLPIDQKAVLDYGRVIADIHQQRDIVPIRYGSLLANEDVLRNTLEKQAEQYLTWLRQVQGCVEMGVSIPIDKDQQDTRPASGLAYLQWRRQKYRPDQLVLAEAELENAVAGCYRCCLSEVSSRLVQRTLSIVYLVPRNQLSRFQMTLKKVLANKPDWQVTGPWPPYSFVHC